MNKQLINIYSILVYLMLTFIIVGHLKQVETRKFPMKRLIKRSGIDILYENDEDDITVEIDPIEQERQLLDAQNNCTILIENVKKRRKNECEPIWDTIMCWPKAALNTTVQLPCPIYVNKFNRKNYAIKHCKLNPNTSLPSWTKTNFTFCLTPSEHIIEDVIETTIIDYHMRYINGIRMFGYIISLISLFVSIIILLRPKLRCPRNFIHINLFCAFGLRTILIMLVNLLRNNSTIFNMNIDNLTNDTDYSSDVDNDSKFIPCRMLISFYRYSGSVYHVSISSEAIYLMMLLKFPYYSEIKGCKFCIIGSWVLPLVWLIPWIFIRVFVESKWCWQIQSEWNLFLDVPHTILLVINVISAIFIIRVLYTKLMVGKLSREKLMKYRRLAKSTLILIPIFGLHFVFFAWLPYARIANDDSLIELPIVYVETFFNAFQGLVVSIACCFIQREVQIEILLFIISFLKRLKCCRSLKCINYLEKNFIPSLRLNDKRAAQISQAKTKPELRRSSTNMLLDFEYKPNDFKRFTSLRTNSDANNKSRVISKQPRQLKVRSKSTDSKSSEVIQKICCCLLTNQKNDFHQNSSRKKSQFPNQNGKNSKKKIPKKCKASDIHEELKKDLSSDESKCDTALLNVKNKKEENLEKFLEYAKRMNLKASNQNDSSNLIKSIAFIEQKNTNHKNSEHLNLESQTSKKDRNSI